MSVSFNDKSKCPDAAALAELLGKANTAWVALVEHLESEVDGVDLAWKFYGSKMGWQLKATRKRKALLYMIPKPGKFTAALALALAAVDALDDAGLPAALVAEIRAAKTYAEGTPARIEVTSKRQLANVRRLLTLKLDF